MHANAQVFGQLMVWLVFGVITALVAHSRGRNAFGWFFIGCFFACFGLILVLVLPNLVAEQARVEALRRQNTRLKERVRKDRMVSDRRHRRLASRLDVHDRALGLDTADDELEELDSLDDAIPIAAPSQAPPAPDPARVQWHCIVEDQQLGPMSVAELRDLWFDGRVTARSLVWSEQLEDWQAIGRLPQLKAALDG